MNQTLKIALLGLTLSIANTLCGQVSANKNSVSGKEQSVYYEIDAVMRQYVQDSLRYPTDVPPKGWASNVVVHFTINGEGFVENALLVCTGHPSCDAEALRLVKAMPRREPTGKSTCYMLPISFTPRRLSEQQKESEEEVDEVKIPSSCTDQEEECLELFQNEGNFKEARFPGNKESLALFIRDNLKYPVEAQDSGIQGRVIVRFVIDRKGEIRNIKLVQSLHPLCDKEALEIVRKMPKWYPAMLDRRFVQSDYMLPIVFRLKD